MKLLLTSDGFENPKVAEEFLKFFDGGVGNKKVVFLYTSRGFKEEYLEGMRVYWVGMGFRLKNLEFVDMDKEVGELKFDVVCVCGGNTFYILDRMRKTGVFNLVRNNVINGAVYVGMSAGSIIAGPDIELCGRSEDWDINDIGLEDLGGLCLTESIVAPHYIDKDEDIVRESEKERNVKVVRLRDGEVLLIDGNGEMLIR